MPVKIALAGNPNSGKTTMFNDLTGSAQYVGNWPGVTVEKKEGRLKGRPDVIIQDLPGVYSLSPYTLEEVVTRNYLVGDKPDAILNIVDASNIERNLYLTTQLTELGIPVVVALNMIDVVRKNGDRIDLNKLSRALGCEVVETSALKGIGSQGAAIRASELAAAGRKTEPPHVFDGSVEHAIAHIEEAIEGKVDPERARWYAIKLFERDEKVVKQLNLPEAIMAHIERDIAACEEEMEDDAESIITNQRYAFIAKVVSTSVVKARVGKSTASDKIDRVVTNRVLALPIFAIVMFLVYFIAITTVGGVATDWANDGVFGDGWHFLGIGEAQYAEAAGAYEEGMEADEAYQKALADYENGVTDVEPEYAGGEAPDPAAYGVWVPGIPVIVEGWLDAGGTAGWLKSLILDGIVSGVGAVLGFVPQMLILFFMLAILEDVGYMARVAFIMDRIFRRFGLSGKSFIPMLIGSGCSVPGIMASRTIENQRDRRITIMTTSFIPCGAKMPIVALIAGALFGGAWWVAPSAYFIGVASIILSGVMLKKLKAFAGDPSPFVMELPSYHVPSATNVFRSTFERSWSFIKRAGTIILLASIFIWFTSGFGWVNGVFGMVENMDHSMLAAAGGFITPIFHPLGFASWQSTVATLMGLVAKEEVVGVFGVLYGVHGDAMSMVEAGAFSGLAPIAAHFTQLSAFSFLLFNLLCAPCFAAMGAIRREMNSGKWFWIAIGYLTGYAYLVAFTAYQIGISFTAGFSFLTLIALLLLAGAVYMIVRGNPHDGHSLKHSKGVTAS
jgi:ferrous iron transport protein B